MRVHCELANFVFRYYKTRRDNANHYHSSNRIDMSCRGGMWQCPPAPSCLRSPAAVDLLAKSLRQFAENN